MKTMHICAKHHREAFENHKEIVTYRTGWIKEIYHGDHVFIYVKENKELKKEYIVGQVRVHHYKDLAVYNITNKEEFLEEVKAYKRKFNDLHFFIEYQLKPMEEQAC